MNVIEFPDYSGNTIFCDDIRLEVGGKETFVGCYQGQLFIHGELPFLIPKLALGINLMQRRSALVTKDVSLRVYLPGDPPDGEPSAINVAISEETYAGAMETSPTLKVGPEELPNFISIHFRFVFAPVEIKEEGRIRVRAAIGDNLVKLGSLQVALAPKATSPISPASPPQS